MMTLEDVQFQPHNGKPPRKVVIILHGYGADGRNLLPLAKFWRHDIPDALFVAPDAPFPCEVNPEARQWFSLQGWEPGRTFHEDLFQDSLMKAAEILNLYIDRLLSQHQLGVQDIAFVGFSQGTMVAIAAAMARESACAGVLGYSGAYVSSAAPHPCTFPIFLMHGDQDPVVPVSALFEAEKNLKAQGFEVDTRVFPGVEHTISEDGVDDGGWFLQQIFNKKAQKMGFEGY